LPRKAHLLLVDDDPNTLASLSRAFRLAGHEATVCDNAARALWPGEFVQARLVLRVQQDGLTVPAAVVQRGPEGAFAWVVRPDATVVPQPVQVAQMVRGTALVISGLTAGETVVSDGQYGLRPGDKVAPRSPADTTDAPLMNAQTDTLGIQP